MHWDHTIARTGPVAAIKSAAKQVGPTLSPDIARGILISGCRWESRVSGGRRVSSGQGAANASPGRARLDFKWSKDCTAQKRERLYMHVQAGLQTEQGDRTCCKGRCGRKPKRTTCTLQMLLLSSCIVLIAIHMLGIGGPPWCNNRASYKYEY